MQQVGCGALQHLAFNNAANQAAIASAGGIEVVVAAMGAHASDAAVEQNGCSALQYLASNNAANQAAIAAAGGIEAVVAAMGAHAVNEMVQRHGCGALLNLALKQRRELGRCGGGHRAT